MNQSPVNQVLLARVRERLLWLTPETIVTGLRRPTPQSDKALLEDVLQALRGREDKGHSLNTTEKERREWSARSQHLRGRRVGEGLSPGDTQRILADMEMLLAKSHDPEVAA